MLLTSYKWHDWQYPHVLKCQKTGIFNWHNGQGSLFLSLTHTVLGPEECYPKSSLNICSVKFIDMYYNIYVSCERNYPMECPGGMYSTPIHTIKTQRDYRWKPTPREMTNLGTSPSEHPAEMISCFPLIDSGQQWPQWPFLLAVPLRPALLSRTATQKPGVHGSKTQSSPLLYLWLECRCQETTEKALILCGFEHRKTYGLVLLLQRSTLLNPKASSLWIQVWNEQDFLGKFLELEDTSFSWWESALGDTKGSHRAGRSPHSELGLYHWSPECAVLHETFQYNQTHWSIFQSLFLLRFLLSYEKFYSRAEETLSSALDCQDWSCMGKRPQCTQGGVWLHTPVLESERFSSCCSQGRWR